MYISLHKIALYCFMIVIWMGILGLFLYGPRFISPFIFHRPTLNIFTWPGILDPVYLKKFEQQTGIALNISYYESNQELFSKLTATHGQGYDIIIPSDYTVSKLIHHNLLKPIDKSRLPFFSTIVPPLRGLYYDPQLTYSIPFFWSLYGLGVNTQLINLAESPLSWSLIFKPFSHSPSICMTNYPREAIMIAAQYLFGSAHALKSNSAQEKVLSLLQDQKKYVYAYTDDRAKELLISRACAVAVAQAADIERISREYPEIRFIIPKEGGFTFIESIVIPATTTKDDLIYQFINFLYSPPAMEHHVQQFAFCSPIALASSSSVCNYLAHAPNKEFFSSVISDARIDELWHTLMSSGS